MNVLGLFSGIGGFELGFQRAGFSIAAMCEIDPYCRAVLAKHFPGVPVYGDVRGVTAGQLWLDDLAIDVITGGFPCQDISLAGRGAGLGGERSGLWFEFERVIKEVRPRYAVIENVSALRSRGLDVVLGSLAALGYDAEWHCIPASAVGAEHVRDRVWVVAYADRSGLEGLHSARGRVDMQPAKADVAGNFGQADPEVLRTVDGLSGRLDRPPFYRERIRALGNAVVPQIPELLARSILRLDADLRYSGASNKGSQPCT